MFLLSQQKTYQLLPLPLVTWEARERLNKVKNRAIDIAHQRSTWRSDGEARFESLGEGEDVGDLTLRHSGGYCCCYYRRRRWEEKGKYLFLRYRTIKEEISINEFWWKPSSMLWVNTILCSYLKLSLLFLKLSWGRRFESNDEKRGRQFGYRLNRFS